MYSQKEDGVGRQTCTCTGTCVHVHDKYMYMVQHMYL